MASAHQNPLQNSLLYYNFHVRNIQEGGSYVPLKKRNGSDSQGDPFRSLLKFAIPVILGNLFQLFYTLADTMIVGKTLGAQSLAAVGSTSIIIYFVFCFINGFTGGFGICLGQRCGAKDEAGMRKSVAVSTLLSIAFTVFLTLICCLLAHQILIWMQIPPISQEKLMTTCSSSFSARVQRSFTT